MLVSVNIISLNDFLLDLHEFLIFAILKWRYILQHFGIFYKGNILSIKLINFLYNAYNHTMKLTSLFSDGAFKYED